MNILVTNAFPQKIPTHSWSTPTGGGGRVVLLRAPRISKKAGRHPPPPLGEGIQATEKRLGPGTIHNRRLRWQGLTPGQSGKAGPTDVVRAGTALVWSGNTGLRRSTEAFIGGMSSRTPARRKELKGPWEQRHTESSPQRAAHQQLLEWGPTESHPKRGSQGAYGVLDRRESPGGGGTHNPAPKTHTAHTVRIERHPAPNDFLNGVLLIVGLTSCFDQCLPACLCICSGLGLLVSSRCVFMFLCAHAHSLSRPSPFPSDRTPQKGTQCSTLYSARRSPSQHFGVAVLSAPPQGSLRRGFALSIARA